MLKKFWIIALLTALIAVSGFFISGISSTEKTPVPVKSKYPCCKMDIQKCEEKKESNAPGEMIMESLSRQFITISPF